MERLGSDSRVQLTPLGVLNDETRSVKVFLDQDFLQEPGLVGVHPNENTATVWLKAEDLIRDFTEAISQR